MKKLVIFGVAGAVGALTARVARKVQGDRAERDLWREVTDPV